MVLKVLPVTETKIYIKPTTECISALMMYFSQFFHYICQKSNLIQGDWRKHHGANKELLYVIEPFIESLIQLLVQSILVYIVLGPSDSIDNRTSGVVGLIKPCFDNFQLRPRLTFPRCCLNRPPSDSSMSSNWHPPSSPSA